MHKDWMVMEVCGVLPWLLHIHLHGLTQLFTYLSVK